MSSSPVFDLTTLIGIQSSYLQDLCGNNPNLTYNVNALQTGLNRMNEKYSSNTTADVLTDQDKVIDLVNTEYKRLLQKKQSVDNAVYGQERAALLNESYRLRYVEYTKILIAFIITALIIIVAYQIQNYILTFIPSFLFDFFIFVLCTITLFYCYFVFVSIASRDPLNFNEINLNPPNVLTSDQLEDQQLKAAKKGDLLGSINLNSCVGPSCCSDGTLFDSNNNLCVIPTSSHNVVSPTPTPTPTSRR